MRLILTVSLLGALLDLGVCLIDTARSYGLSEERIGQLIKDCGLYRLKARNLKRMCATLSSMVTSKQVQSVAVASISAVRLMGSSSREAGFTAYPAEVEREWRSSAGPRTTAPPLALKVPFYHSNVDYDEVLFYHSGEFFSRAGIAPGMLTFHPQGIHHGPQEKAFDRAAKATRTEEVAVMLDTKFPLKPCEAVSRTEMNDYWRSWQK